MGGESDCRAMDGGVVGWVTNSTRSGSSSFQSWGMVSLTCLSGRTRSSLGAAGASTAVSSATGLPSRVTSIRSPASAQRRPSTIRASASSAVTLFALARRGCSFMAHTPFRLSSSQSALVNNSGAQPGSIR